MMSCVGFEVNRFSEPPTPPPSPSPTIASELLFPVSENFWSPPPPSISSSPPCHINPLMPNSDLQILLCLTPDDFTRERETPQALKG